MSDLLTFADRIKFYRDQKGYKAKEFERICGLSNAYLDKTSSVGTKILERILNACPDLNRDWVLYGSGEMLKSIDNTKNNQTDIVTKKDEEMEKLRIEIMRLNDKLADKEELISVLKDRIEGQKDVISSLMGNSGKSQQTGS